VYYFSAVSFPVPRRRVMVKEKLLPRSVMFRPTIWFKLQRMARQKAAKTNRPVTASTLVREMVEGLLDGGRAKEEVAVCP
jgi:hypothetical protein